jgi:hypothetical protein
MSILIPFFLSQFRYNDRIQVAPATVGNALVARPYGARGIHHYADSNGNSDNDNYADPAVRHVPTNIAVLCSFYVSKPITGEVENIVDSLISTLNSLLAPLEGGGGGGGGIL